jgi:hypothetical protein
MSDLPPMPDIDIPPPIDPLPDGPIRDPQPGDPPPPERDPEHLPGGEPINLAKANGPTIARQILSG